MKTTAQSKPTKKGRKPGKAQLIKQADKYFSLYVRHRDGVKRSDGWYTSCITCPSVKPLKQMQAGHFQSRSKYPTRWDEENVNAQCPSCNVWKYGEQYKQALALDMKYGDGTAERLARQANEPKKFTISDLEEIISFSKAQIKQYEEE